VAYRCWSAISGISDGFSRRYSADPGGAAWVRFAPYWTLYLVEAPIPGDSWEAYVVRPTAPHHRCCPVVRRAAGAPPTDLLDSHGRPHCRLRPVLPAVPMAAVGRRRRHRAHRCPAVGRGPTGERLVDSSRWPRYRWTRPSSSGLLRRRLDGRRPSTSSRRASARRRTRRRLRALLQSGGRLDPFPWSV
jgi:hypothetical protein